MGTRIKLVESIRMPNILYCMETWNIRTEIERKEIDKLHKRLLTRVLEIEHTTSYWGILAETARKTVKEDFIK